MSQYQGWIAGMPQSVPPRIEQMPLAAEAIAKGRVCYTNDAGFITIAQAGSSAKRPHFVTTEAVDNSGGSPGDLYVPVVVGRGQQVTVQTKTTLSPGDPVKVGATDGMVALFDVALDDENLKIGTYIGKEPGLYAKDSGSPYAESYTTDYTSADAAIDDIVIIELGQ